MELESIIGSEDIEVDMSPMIDMVFLLLIFFIVASIVVEDKVLVDIPMAVYAKVPEDITGRFIITVKKDGSIYVEPSHQQVTVEEFKALLAPQVDADPKLRVLIRADRHLTYESDEKIMDACAEVGATDLIFSAFEE